MPFPHSLTDINNVDEISYNVLKMDVFILIENLKLVQLFLLNPYIFVIICFRIITLEEEDITKYSSVEYHC